MRKNVPDLSVWARISSKSGVVNGKPDLRKYRFCFRVWTRQFRLHASVFPAAALTMARTPTRTWSGNCGHRAAISTRSEGRPGGALSTAGKHGLSRETVRWPVPGGGLFEVTSGIDKGCVFRAADCKSVGVSLRWFEPTSPHQLKINAILLYKRDCVFRFQILPPHLRDVAKVIRSKSAGPFEITMDIIFKTNEEFHSVWDKGIISKELA